MFDRMKALLDMKKKISEIKQQLDQTVFETKSPDGLVTIVMNGAQQTLDVVLGQSEPIDRQKLQKSIKETFNSAIKRSQEIAAQKMKDITGLSLPPGG